MKREEFDKKYHFVNIKVDLDEEHYLFLDGLFQVIKQHINNFEFTLTENEHKTLKLKSNLSVGITDNILKELNNISLTVKLRKINEEKSKRNISSSIRN